MFATVHTSRRISSRYNISIIIPYVRGVAEKFVKKTQLNLNVQSIVIVIRESTGPPVRFYQFLACMYTIYTIFFSFSFTFSLPIKFIQVF